MERARLNPLSSVVPAVSSLMRNSTGSALAADASSYRWVAAAIGSQNAAGLQLDVVQREEFEAVKDMARLAREENEALKARITALEGKADEMHDKGLHDLFRASVSGGNGLDFFVGNEVYDHLEKVVDRFDDVANVMHGIVIEHV